jgi:nucleotide-binding universal stress UspA family protein
MKRVVKEGIAVEALSASGKLSDFVNNLAKEKDVDVIITGSCENGGSRYFFKGSLIDKILERSICAALVVRR